MNSVSLFPAELSMNIKSWNKRCSGRFSPGLSVAASRKTVPESCKALSGFPGKAPFVEPQLIDL